MKYPQYDYAVIGGDMRQTYLAQELSFTQSRVCHYALMSVPASGSAEPASSLESACMHSRCIICPIPFTKNSFYLNQTALEKLSLKTLLSALQPGQYFFAGCIPAEFREEAEQKGIHTYDLMENEELSLFNTFATAEGSICEAISRSPFNLYQSRCAVLGYGRCGRTLTAYLKGMFCHVSVYTDDKTQQEDAGSTVDYSGALDRLKSQMKEYDFIFNTIPALILTDDILSTLKPVVTIIDIASAPGGVDYNAAKRLDISASLCLGLPGKYAPASSAAAIKETIEAILAQEKQP
jgi:dipicolinate synthase subunit A